MRSAARVWPNRVSTPGIQTTNGLPLSLISSSGVSVRAERPGRGSDLEAPRALPTSVRHEPAPPQPRATSPLARGTRVRGSRPRSRRANTGDRWAPARASASEDIPNRPDCWSASRRCWRDLDSSPIGPRAPKFGCATVRSIHCHGCTRRLCVAWGKRSSAASSKVSARICCASVATGSPTAAVAWSPWLRRPTLHRGLRNFRSASGQGQAVRLDEHMTPRFSLSWSDRRVLPTPPPRVRGRLARRDVGSVARDVRQRADQVRRHVERLDPREGHTCGLRLRARADVDVVQDLEVIG
jgi:hypothetical protein